MIIVFYGKRNSGKTTLCREFYGWVKSNLPLRCHYLDSDKLRFIYGMKGFSKETERALIDKSMEIAQYEESLNDLVLMSMSFAYEDQRKKFAENKSVLWIYLKHDDSQRNSNKKEYQDYEEPDTDGIDTTKSGIEESLSTIISRYRDFNSNSTNKNK